MRFRSSTQVKATRSAATRRRAGRLSATSASRPIRPRLAEQPLPERPSRRSHYDAAAADTAGEFHPQDDPRVRVGDMADFDLAESPRQVVGVHHDAWPGHQGQVPPIPKSTSIRNVSWVITASVKSSFTSPAVNRISIRRGTTQRPVRVTSPNRWSIRTRSLACSWIPLGGRSAVKTASSLRVRADSAALKRSSSSAAVSRPSPAATRQDLDNPIPVRMRRPQLRLRTGTRRATGWRDLTCHIDILVSSADLCNVQIQRRYGRNAGSLRARWPGWPGG